MKKLLIHIFTFYIWISSFGIMQISAQNCMSEPITNTIGNIYLYGESHAVEKLLKKEIDIWDDYYNNKGFRHLFIETAYYTAELLNIWMKEETNEILDKIYDDWVGTLFYNPLVKNFFIEIKNRFPKTIFHGTDIGHQYKTTGKRYLEYLLQQNMENSEQYIYTKEAINQGEYYHSKKDDIYRENMMVANFIREFNKLNNESIMGIYGSAHTGINSMDKSNAVPCMANQLHKLYANQLFSENMVDLVKNEPLRIDTLKINGSYYKALYFGRKDLSGFKDYAYRDFWRLEDAYKDFKKARKTGDVLPYHNYPMNIETGQVFVIDYMKTDSTMFRRFFKSDGKFWNNLPATEEFKVK